MIPFDIDPSLHPEPKLPQLDDGCSPRAQSARPVPDDCGTGQPPILPAKSDY